MKRTLSLSAEEGQESAGMCVQGWGYSLFLFWTVCKSVQYDILYFFCYCIQINIQYVIQSVIVNIALHIKEWTCQWITCRLKKYLNSWFSEVYSQPSGRVFFFFFVLLLDRNRKYGMQYDVHSQSGWPGIEPWLTAWRNLNTFNKHRDKECIWSKGWKRNLTVVLCTKMMSGLHLRKHEPAA